MRIHREFEFKEMDWILKYQGVNSITFLYIMYRSNPGAVGDSELPLPRRNYQVVIRYYEAVSDS